MAFSYNYTVDISTKKLATAPQEKYHLYFFLSLYII